jgi:hypothetical protein
VLFAYDDVIRLLRDPALSVEDRNAHSTPLTETARDVMGEAADRGNRAMLSLDPTLDGNAIEELLRYDSPVQMSRRITLRDIDIKGKSIEAGRPEWNGRINLRGLARLPLATGS